MPSTTHTPLPVKGVLVSQGVSIKDFADRVGYSPQHVSEVLNRTRPLTRAFVEAAVAALDLDPQTVGLYFGPPSTWGVGRWPK